MKKFCSKCGSQLDLGKRNCSSCQAFNPFFIAGFTSTSQSEPEVPAHEEPVVNKSHISIEEAAKTERLERERVELSLKNELLKVKEETEQYKKETLDLVKGVQNELHHIEAENKLLKERVELLNSSAANEERETLHVPLRNDEHPVKSSKNFTAIAAVVLLVIATGVSYLVFNHASKSDANSVNAVKPASSSLATETTANSPVKASTDSVPTHKLLATVTATPARAAITPAAAAPAAPVKTTPAPFSLTSSKVTGDLVGKKLSGCDITINNISEIEHVDNLVLVDKLSASYLKYKCTVKIKQGAETYTANPYIYYSADGTFIKVDGTNCE